MPAIAPPDRPPPPPELGGATTPANKEEEEEEDEEEREVKLGSGAGGREEMEVAEEKLGMPAVLLAALLAADTGCELCPVLEPRTLGAELLPLLTSV
jgi:hypothetical protein